MNQVPSKALTDLSALSGSVNELLVQQKKSSRRQLVKLRESGSKARAKSLSKANSDAAPSGRAFGHGVGTLKARTLIM